MSYALPIVGTVEDGGTTFRVRAIPWGLAREASRDESPDNTALMEKIYERCVEVADGDKPPVDDLPAPLVHRLVRLAIGAGEENPPSPPPSTAPDSGG